MRVLFFPFPLLTHYFHQAPLAWAMRSAGHDVRIVVAHGQQSVLDAVIRSGMTAVQAGEDFDVVGVLAAVTADDADGPLPPEEFHRRNRGRLDAFRHASERLARDLMEFNAWWRPDLIVADPMATIAPLVAGVAKVPLVRHLFGVDVMRLQAIPGSGAPVDGDVRESWPPPLRRMYDHYGVEVRADYAARVVDPCPLSMELPELPTPANRLPIRYVPYNGPGVVPDWLPRTTDRPRVCVTWGTVATALRGRRVFAVPDILTALARLDVEVIAALSRSDRELLGEPPAGVHVVDPVPLHLLLPTCDAIIHHGGGGAMLTAASLGVPQLVYPLAIETALNARQLVNVGAGSSIGPKRADARGFEAAEADVDTYTSAITALLDGAVTQGARRLRSEIQAQPTPAEVTRHLEALV
jgi:UDP:flavonoid glycosyltransferase YjiC (YdhE family)